MGELPLLRLLVDEAPIEAFEAPLRDARAGGRPGPELEALRDEKVLRSSIDHIVLD